MTFFILPFIRKKYDARLLKIIGRVSLARENEAGGSWGQKVHILHVNVVLFLVVIIELFQSNNFSYTVRKIITSKSSGTLCR